MMTRVLADDARDATDRTAALLPPAPTTREATGLSLDLFVQLVLKLLHFSGELTRHRDCAPPRRRILGDRAGARFRQASAPVRNRRRRRHRRTHVSLSDYGQRPPARDAVPREQSVCRRRAGAARAVRGVSRGVSQCRAAIDYSRTRARGVLASRAERARARSGRARRSARRIRCSSTDRPATARR